MTCETISRTNKDNKWVDDGEPVCRICYGDGLEGTLVQPCGCRGSVAWIHKACLDHWVDANLSSDCELCGQMYKTRFIYRWWEFWKDPLFRNIRDRENITLYINLATHLVSTLCISFGINMKSLQVVRPMYSTILCVILIFLSLALITLAKNIAIYAKYQITTAYRSFRNYGQNNEIHLANG